ncbi:uncharacterized protein LOC144820223 [Lissotriton helveticus]
MSLTLLQLLVICALLSVGITASLELRCQCIKKMADFIPTTQISKIELILAGAHCPRVEVIATLKQGMQTCLDPEAEWVKRIIDRMINSRNADDIPSINNKMDLVITVTNESKRPHATESKGPHDTSRSLKQRETVSEIEEVIERPRYLTCEELHVKLEALKSGLNVNFVKGRISHLSLLSL